MRRPSVVGGVGGVVGLLMLCACAPPGIDAAPSPEFMVIASDDSGLRYNPTGEFIFPSIVDTAETSINSLDRYVLYYAPHEPPGGISLMTAPTLDGPWTEFGENPVIAADSSPAFSVSHVSSPDAVWDAVEQRLLLYFHGENDTIRVASSIDGVTFEHLGIAVGPRDDEPDVTENSYARVVPREYYGAPGAGFTMLFMDKPHDAGRRIRVADSPDGISWTVRPEPLIVPGGIEGSDVSGANIWSSPDGVRVLYHGSTGVIWSRTADASLAALGEPCAFVVDAEGRRVAAPEVVSTTEAVTMFVEIGDRLAASIASTRLDEAAVSACADAQGEIKDQ